MWRPREGVRETGNNQLDRRAVVAELLRDPSDVLVIAGLGAASYDLAAAGDRPLNFYLWGAMGGAAMIGLGLARAQPNRRVLVITGDGEMLMGMGALATITAAGATNLAIAVLDNGQYGETGAQASHTQRGADLVGIAAACGWTATHAMTMEEVRGLRPRLRREKLFALIGISPEEKPRFLPPKDGAWLTTRFRAALGLPA